MEMNRDCILRNRDIHDYYIQHKKYSVKALILLFRSKFEEFRLSHANDATLYNKILNVHQTLMIQRNKKLNEVFLDKEFIVPKSKLQHDLEAAAKMPVPKLIETVKSLTQSKQDLIKQLKHTGVK